MTEELDLKELEKLAAKYKVDGRPAVQDWLTDSEADELVILLQALPRLIDELQSARACIKVLSPYALHESCAEQE